jgi:hypothetical protein
MLAWEILETLPGALHGSSFLGHSQGHVIIFRGPQVGQSKWHSEILVQVLKHTNRWRVAHGEPHFGFSRIPEARQNFRQMLASGELTIIDNNNLPMVGGYWLEARFLLPVAFF